MVTRSRRRRDQGATGIVSREEVVRRDVERVGVELPQVIEHRIELALATRVQNMKLKAKGVCGPPGKARSWLGQRRDCRIDQKPHDCGGWPRDSLLIRGMISYRRSNQQKGRARV